MNTAVIRSTVIANKSAKHQLRLLGCPPLCATGAARCAAAWSAWSASRELKRGGSDSVWFQSKTVEPEERKEPGPQNGNTVFIQYLTSLSRGNWIFKGKDYIIFHRQPPCGSWLNCGCCSNGVERTILYSQCFMCQYVPLTFACFFWRRKILQQPVKVHVWYGYAPLNCICIGKMVTNHRKFASSLVFFISEKKTILSSELQGFVCSNCTGLMTSIRFCLGLFEIRVGLNLLEFCFQFSTTWLSWFPVVTLLLTCLVRRTKNNKWEPVFFLSVGAGTQ